MNPRQEAVITALLAGSCLAVALAQVLPRMIPRFEPLVVERPELVVDVTGAIASPGTYRLEWGSRLGDLVTLAGGLAPGAAADLVNAARLLTTGESVHVPWASTDDGEDRISLNSADEWTLQRLPGVGPAMAARIVAGRPYDGPDDLLRVPGIGEATLARLLPLVRP